MTRSAGVVDRGHRDVIAVPGDDRLSWLHLLLTQHVSDAAGGQRHRVADPRPERPCAAPHVGRARGRDGATWTPSRVTGRSCWPTSTPMRFWSAVEPARRHRRARRADRRRPGDAVRAGRGRVCRSRMRPYGSAAAPGGGFVRRMPWPGRDAADVVVPRADKDAWWERLTGAGARPGRDDGVRGAACRVAAAAPARRHRRADDPARGRLDRRGRAPGEGLLPGPGDGRAGGQPGAAAAAPGAAAPGRGRRGAAGRPATWCSATGGRSAGWAPSSSTTSSARSRWRCSSVRCRSTPSSSRASRTAARPPRSPRRATPRTPGRRPPGRAAQIRGGLRG